ncbi:curli production assembly/transport component CsgG [bacterium BMS3Abin03]|nr:curli production assembly/transport component CsgG [bacterium BMS3Abin03]
MKNIIIKTIFLGMFLIFISGCNSFLEPVKTYNATVGPTTTVSKQLSSLPQPKEKIVAAVYKFRDQTGQYKASNVGTSWSTAVTQGATSILLKALEESGWFIAIEREGLSNLLNERKIIRSSRANYSANKNENEQLLPPLLYAGVILEGGIISYDTNILTGGEGVKYFGVGGSDQYRQDRISIYLRAISTQSGRILKTVYTTKMILSQQVDVGVYRFVDFQRLLEVETGYSSNEPVELCVKEAIEKAVESLIIEGIKDNLWNLKNPSEIASYVIQEYELEKEKMKVVDSFGENTIKRSQLSLGINVGSQFYSGDYPNARYEPAGALSLHISFSQKFSFHINIGASRVSAEKSFTSDITNGDIILNYSLSPQYRLNPFVQFGIGAINITSSDRNGNAIESGNSWSLSLISGVGVEYLFGSSIGLQVLGDHHYLITDNLDGVKHGKFNDYYWGIRFGVNFYFGR